MRRITLDFEVTREIRELMMQIFTMRDLSIFLGIQPNDFKSERAEIELSRVRHYYPDINPEILLAEDAVPGEEEQRAINIAKAYRLIEKGRAEKLSKNLLIKIQTALLDKLPEVSFAGQFRQDEKKDLFSFVSDPRYPGSDQVEDLLDDVFLLANDAAAEPLVKCWLVYYLINAIQPFNHDNELIARLACYAMLKHDQLHFNYLLNIEEYIFGSTGFIAYSYLYEQETFQKKTERDLTGYLEICLEAMLQNVKASEKKYFTRVARHQLGYDALPPRSKNFINFWLKKGFYANHEIIFKLSPRQHEILVHLLKHGGITTKDLSTIFEVDRKTIQRDFNQLIDYKIVGQKGAGRAIKYYISFDKAEESPLEKWSVKV